MDKHTTTTHSNKPWGLNRFKPWRYILRQWYEYQWRIVGGIVLMTLVLGYLGFENYLSANQRIVSEWDILYLTVQLFTLESGAVRGIVPWELQVARFMAPALLAFTAIKAFVVVFRDQLQLYRVRFVTDHVIICGLGEKGLLLAKEFRAAAYPVVVLEKDLQNSKFQQCREIGALFLVGNASDPERLAKAKILKALYLFSVCGEDGANAEIAVHARELVANRKSGVLTCFIHIADSRLVNLLREKEIVMQKADAFRLEFFNIYDSGARALLNSFPPYQDGSKSDNGQPHLLIVGLGKLGEEVLVQMARQWPVVKPIGGQKLIVSVVDENAEQRIKLLSLRYPKLNSVCRIVNHDILIPSAEFQQADYLFEGAEKPAITLAYVCLDQPSESLSAGLFLRQQLRAYKIPIVVQMIHKTGLATLLAGESEDHSLAESDNLKAFPLFNRTCTRELLLGGTHEILARAMHAEYVRNLKPKAVDNPSLVPWEDLPETLKNSNRRQADHIGIKLRQLGYGIAPLNDWNEELFQFDPAEIETMAEMEHQRWVDERKEDGWHYAKGPKDIENKTSPYLVPWDGLSEDIKDLDRNTVKELPMFLAKAGFQLCRANRVE